MHKANLHQMINAVGKTNATSAMTTSRSLPSQKAMDEIQEKIAALIAGRSIAILAAGGFMMTNIASIDQVTDKMIYIAEMLKKAHPNMVDAQQNRAAQCTGTRLHTNATPTNVPAVELIVSIIGVEPSR